MRRRENRRGGWPAKIAVALAATALIGCGQTEQASSKAVIATQNIPASLQCTSNNAGGVLYLNLHHDEQTSVEAARNALFVPGFGNPTALLCALTHTGGRNVAFDMGGQRFTFDPNRMFTDRGARLSLERLSHSDSAAADVPQAVVDKVRRFAGALVDSLRLDARPYVVALHNNTEANYSAESYLPGREYAGDAAEVHLAPEADPDNFFFVTTRELFGRLSGLGFNVVLQNNETATDDGSLSVYCGRKGIGYVNVEAQHGHLEAQQRMIRALAVVLASPDRP